MKKYIKMAMVFTIIFSILFSNYISYGATTMTEWGFPRTSSIFIKESVKGVNPGYNNIPEYRDYYGIPMGGGLIVDGIYGTMQHPTIEGTADNYTFTIMGGLYGTHHTMKDRYNPMPGSLEVDGIQRSYYLPYRHDYVFKYDNGREGRFPIWYMKGLDTANRIQRDSVKSELEEIERKVYDIEYLAYKIRQQGEPTKAGDYHTTHSLLLKQYAKDYRTIFSFNSTIDTINYSKDQIAASTRVLDKVMEWIENNRIQPMEILDFRVGEYSGIINRDNKAIDVYLPPSYVIKESDIKIQLPDWVIARKRPGDLKLGGSIRYLVKPVDALYENFPKDVSPYAMYQDWTINFIEIDEENPQPAPQLNSIFYINSNGERIYGEIDGEEIELKIPNHIEDEELAVNIYYFGKELFKVEDSVYKQLQNKTRLPLGKEVELKITGNNDDTNKIYKLTIKSEKSDKNSILDFYIEGINTEVDDDTNRITLYPKYSDDISQLRPSIRTSHRARVEPASQIIQDFNQIEKYMVTSESGQKQEYEVKVIRGVASAEKEIKSFRIGTINGEIEGNTINIELPSNIKLKEVQPTIEISEKAKISPASGEKVNLSSKELIYKVIAEDGSIQNYKLIVEIDEVEIPGVDQEFLKELKRIRDGIYQRYKNSNQLTDDWDWMNIGFYEGIDNGIEPDGIRKGIEDLPKKYDIHGQINKLEHFKMTDLDRFTMSATAMGIDASNLSKYTTPNKPFKFKNGQVVDNMVEEIYSKETVGGINGAAFALIALDMGNYTVPEDANYTRENILEALLKMNLDQQFDVDMVGMVIQSLYPYKEHPIYGERVREHIDYGMDLILGQVPAKHVNPMKEDFTFESWGTVNSESVAQVICALASLGIDPHTDYRFSDNEKSLITQWLNKFSTLEKNGFGHTNREYNHMATYQSMYALQWYINFLEKGGAGNPYSLYYDSVLFDFGRTMSDEAHITFFEILGKSGEIDHKRGIIAVTIPDKTEVDKLVTEPIIRINDGSKITPKIGSIEDFRDDTIYTVTSEDGKNKQEYRIVIDKADVKSGEREMEEVKISGLSALSTTIDQQNRQISIVLSSDTKQSQLKSMTLELKHSGVDISPNPLEPQDCTKDVIYTITAEDGQESQYTIKVSIDQGDKYKFTKFVLRGVEGKIDALKSDITVNLPYGTYVETVILNEAEYTPWESTTHIVPAPTSPRHFEDENIYKIVPYPADNTVEYNIKLNYTEPKGNSKITKFSIGNHIGKIDNKSIILEIPTGMTKEKFIETLRDKEPNIEWSEETRTIDPMPGNERNSLKYQYMDNGVKKYKDDYLKDYVLSDSEGNVNLYVVKFTGGTGGNPDPDPDDPNNSKENKIEITSFKVNGIESTIDNGNGRIFLEIPFETDNYRVVPTIVLSENTEIYPRIGETIDLRRDNIYILKRGNISKKYQLIVKRSQPKPATLLWRYMEEDLNIPYYQRVD